MSTEVPHDGDSVSASEAPLVFGDEGMAFRAIVGEFTSANALLRLIAERIRAAAGHLRLSREDLHRIFSRHSIFEGQMQIALDGQIADFILVETYHQIQGMIGKGALKLVFPEDLLGQGPQFQEAGPGKVEVLPPSDPTGWHTPSEPQMVVKRTMREFMTGESLSMSLKSQATGAPFAGSEGLVLCARQEFHPATGRYYLHSVLHGTEEASRQDKILIEHLMNKASELLTRADRIGFNRIVHAAETNSTLNARLDLQLPTNVVEGHLRTLLREQPGIIIGDEDMTARLRELLEQPGYVVTDCCLARAAAQMQREHSVLLPASRAKLRRLLAELNPAQALSATEFREIVDLFFGTGETPQNEDRLYHHRQGLLRNLSAVLTARSLDECGESEVLVFYLKNLLDNQRILLEAALVSRLPAGQPLPVDWFNRAPLLSRSQISRLATLMPSQGTTRDKVKESFWEVVNLLCEAKAELPRYTPDPYLQARKQVLECATRAITVAGELLPSADRISFFLLPLAYECVTPRLGVVTRKPVAVCGSELRPEAMAVGGVMSMEILLKKITGQAHPLRGLKLAIEGLGNAGKHVATTMMHKGAVIVGVSDSRGALLCPDGFSREEMAVIIAHKNSGRRLDTLLASPAAQGLSERHGKGIAFLPQPQELQAAQADLLVLAAIPDTIRADNASTVRARVVCELAGGAVSGDAKRLLKDRQVQVIPDNLASSGGLLVSFSEMLQNSAGQNWDRELEEYNLYEQLARSFETVLAIAAEHDVDAPTASDILALSRMHELARFREALETAAGRLAAGIQSLGTKGRALIVSDGDEDGVASAAILHTLIAELNPGAESRLAYLNESFRTDEIIECVRRDGPSAAESIKHVFVLDRAFPLSDQARDRLAVLLGYCPVTLINNHTRPATAEVETSLDPNFLFISPQTLHSPRPTAEFSTAMVLRELGHQLLHRPEVLARIDWQAAVGTCLEAPEATSSEWLWFFTQFNPDRTLEAARAVRMVSRAGGFLNALQALVSITRPDLLPTHQSWHQFMNEFRVLAERVQILVDKIVLENRFRPFTAHLFTHEEVASPTPVAGNAANELDLYHWISEHLTCRSNLAEKPIIVGQLVPGADGKRELSIRIRSPRGVDLMEAGLPEYFETGGLPNTAVARVPLPAQDSPEQEFQRIVDAIWRNTTSPMYLAASSAQAPSEAALSRF